RWQAGWGAREPSARSEVAVDGRRLTIGPQPRGAVVRIHHVHEDRREDEEDRENDEETEGALELLGSGGTDLLHVQERGDAPIGPGDRVDADAMIPAVVEDVEPASCAMPESGPDRRVAVRLEG